MSPHTHTGDTVPRISVCMATYNGAAFIEAQLHSILDQLGESDEVILVDDGSTDNTLDVVRSLGDDRIVVSAQTNRGHVLAFETAMSLAVGEVILLSDQDDLWPTGRVRAMEAALQQGSSVAGALLTFGGHRDGQRLAFSPAAHRRLPWWLADFALGRLPYYGSAMGVTREVRDLCLPIPGYVEAHDHWIAMVGRQAGQVVHIPDVVTLRREHGTNLSPISRRSIVPVLRTRGIMLRMAVQAAVRIRARGRHHLPVDSIR